MTQHKENTDHRLYVHARRASKAYTGCVDFEVLPLDVDIEQARAAMEAYMNTICKDDPVQTHVVMVPVLYSITTVQESGQ